MKIRMAIAAVVGLALVAPLSAASNYPDKPIRIIVPYQAGQGTDVATRLLAEQLGTALRQSVIVENRPGAGGNIGAAEAARATPDGYTLLMGTNGTHVLNEYLYASTSFSPEKDFAPIMFVSAFPMMVLATPDSPYKTLSEVMAAAKAKPDQINVAMPSTTAQLVLAMMGQKGLTGLRGIPYKGSATSMTDTIGGQVQLAIDTVSASRPFISSGRLKALAVTSSEATALAPGVPTAAEQGLKDFQVVAWNGLYAPAGTPAPVIQRINAEMEKILARPEIKQRFLDLGHEVQGGPPGRLAEFARSERLVWQPVIAASGLRIE